MMDSNVHIDPATFRFPGPTKSSIDKGSPPSPHPKRLLGQLQPRSAGFSYGWEVDQSNLLGEDLDARRFNRQICKELVKGPPDATQKAQPPPEHRKRSIKTVFTSRSRRKSSKESKKMPVATQTTSDGRKYGQILSAQIYHPSGNASTYQVNRIRGPLAPPTSEAQRKHTTASCDLVGNATSGIPPVNGTKQPVSERSAHSSLRRGEAEHRLPPDQTAATANPRFGNLGNRLLADRLVEGNTAAGRNDETLGCLPIKSTSDDSLGLLKDIFQILSGSETTTSTAGASQVPGAEAGYQPRVRDFAANGSAQLSHARAAIRRRSCSPATRTGQLTEAPDTPDRPSDAGAGGGQPASQHGRSPNSTILRPMASKRPARKPLEPALPITQEQVPGTQTSPVIYYHSKASSVVSAESTPEDILSDASSGVVSNAQSAVFVKLPPQPGPAPLKPLPSLPEGIDSFVPATPRAGQSSRRLASLESSPSKVPPQKSPARSQYKLYPSAASTPPKKPGSPMRMNAPSEPEQLMTRPSPSLPSKRSDSSLPSSDCLPTSMSVGTLDELDHWNKERTDNTRQRKLRDLARHKATIAEVGPVTRNAADGEMYNEGVAVLPMLMDSYNAAFSPSHHGPQGSQRRNLSASTTLRHRDNSTLSQKLSPIIVVAEQKPTLPVQRAPSPNAHFGRDSIDEQTRSFKGNGFYPVPPHLASLTTQRPDESKARPVSSQSLPVPRPVAARVPTPHLSPLLRGPSSRSLRCSSIHEVSGLEARLSAMERKNTMLERAFLAVLDTSATFGGSPGRNGMEGACGDTSSGCSGRDGDRFARASGTESLYVALKNLMAMHNGSAGARSSTSSGP